MIHPSKRSSTRALAALLLLVLGVAAPQSFAQEKSVGGKEHDDNILGVKIGMDVPTALQTIFENSGRKPGQEKPDAKKNEGKDNKDIRVLYKGLQAGDVQIVFADGKYVKEIVLDYASKPHNEDLRLPNTGFIGGAMAGQRYDDRYTVGFTNDKQEQNFWWRDDKTAEGYRVRVGFISKKLVEERSASNKTITRKIITVTPGDAEKFAKAMAAR
ncbi:MAG TPA: hypothetical protein VJT82_13030 [Pyrinomonadaceae bacterium]|nr:hypothetical protein [Pyrinomonadaceae bacterium]